MSETRFTKGPWKWSGDRLMSLNGPVIDSAAHEGMWFARYDEDEDEANVNLIAAAPELYAALTRCLNFIENTESEMGESLPSGEIARAALAKARGEA